MHQSPQVGNLQSRSLFLYFSFALPGVEISGLCPSFPMFVLPQELKESLYKEMNYFIHIPSCAQALVDDK